jgi:hypothetical protein
LIVGIAVTLWYAPGSERGIKSNPQTSISKAGRCEHSPRQVSISTVMILMDKTRDE